MHLFSPDRPKLANGVPTLLLDGGIVPNISVFPAGEGMVKLLVMLRAYDPSEPFSFSYRSKEIETRVLSEFFTNYALDPEQTLTYYFDWVPKSPIRRGQSSPTSRSKAAPALLSADIAASFDLL